VTKDRPYRVSKSYSGRSEGYVVVNRQLEREAVELMAKWAPGIKSQGRFLSRLIYEYAARMEERERWQQQLKHMYPVEACEDVAINP
jgi:hypothetical protein